MNKTDLAAFMCGGVASKMCKQPGLFWAALTHIAAACGQDKQTMMFVVGKNNSLAARMHLPDHMANVCHMIEVLVLHRLLGPSATKSVKFLFKAPYVNNPRAIAAMAAHLQATKHSFSKTVQLVRSCKADQKARAAQLASEHM